MDWFENGKRKVGNADDLSGTFGLVSVKDENYSSLLLSDKPLGGRSSSDGVQCVPWHTSVLEALVAQAQNSALETSVPRASRSYSM